MPTGPEFGGSKGRRLRLTGMGYSLLRMSWSELESRSGVIRAVCDISVWRKTMTIDNLKEAILTRLIDAKVLDISINDLADWLNLGNLSIDALFERLHHLLLTGINLS